MLVASLVLGSLKGAKVLVLTCARPKPHQLPPAHSKVAVGSGTVGTLGDGRLTWASERYHSLRLAALALGWAGPAAGGSICSHSPQTLVESCAMVVLPYSTMLSSSAWVGAAA